MNILVFLLRLLAIAGFGIAAGMMVYYLLVHHNSTPEEVADAYFNLIQTMLVYVGGCLLLFISCMPNIIWKWDSRMFWQKTYFAGLVVSFPGLGLGILMLVASMPK
jgi:hypothetical protein